MEEESADLPASQEKRKSRKKKKKKKGAGEGPVRSSAHEPSDGDAGACEETTDASSITGVPPGTEDAQVDGAGEHAPQPPGRKRRLEGGGGAPAPAPATSVQEEPPQGEELSVTPEKKKKRRRKKQLCARTPAAEGSREAPPPPEEEPAGAPQVRRKKIPVVFEFEADELQASNGHAGDQAASAQLHGGPPPRPGAKTPPPKKKKTTTEADFVAFQAGAAVPTPLFCRTKGGVARKVTSKVSC